jgi:sugar phosphate isomerase/epimerase
MSAHARLSLNQATTKHWTLPEAVAGCVEAGIGGIGLWRDRVAEVGAGRAARLVADAGLTVTSLCRGGFLSDAEPAARKAAYDDNRRAVDEAALVGARELVLVVGGLPEGSRDLVGARAAVADALEALVPYAAAAGVRLALEPLHPIFCADRAVLSTLGQELDLAAGFAPGEVGVCVDAYHVWWDPDLPAQLDRAAGRIALFQVADWVVPLAADALLSRGHLGAGSIDFPAITAMVTAAGYAGWVEVEIFRQDVWDAPGRDTVTRVVSTFDELVAPALPDRS